MGRIKTTLIKRISRELIEKHGQDFKRDFSENKTIISKYAEIHSKKLRNVITGYITHLKKYSDDL